MANGGGDVLRARARQVLDAAEKREKRAASGGPDEAVHRAVARCTRERAEQLERTARLVDEYLATRSHEIAPKRAKRARAA
jgi:hypothetical protein